MSEQLDLQTRATKNRTSNHFIDAAGSFLVIILSFIAWHLPHEFEVSSLLPLLVIACVIVRVIFELTWNRHNVPTIPTGFIARRHMASILRPYAEKKKAPFHIVDFGSGRGELTRYLARSVPNSTVTGLEISPLPFAQARFIQRHFGPHNVAYHKQDFDSFECAATDAVVMYLSGALTQHVGQKLWRELPSGALVIAHTFELGGPWQPLQEITFRTPFFEKLFVYKKP